MRRDEDLPELRPAQNIDAARALGHCPAMAMTTYLQMVSEAEIASLLADPGSINRLDQPEEQSMFTQMQQALCFFLCADAYPNPQDHGPLAGSLAGYQSVETATLENGSFDLVDPGHIKEVAEALAALDVDQFRAKIATTDLDLLVEEEELYDLEVLLAEDDFDLAKLLGEEVTSLVEFYVRAGELGLGVAIYTT